MTISTKSINKILKHLSARRNSIQKLKNLSPGIKNKNELNIMLIEINELTIELLLQEKENDYV